MLRNILKAHFRVNALMINITKNLSVYLFCFALLTACAVKKDTVKKQDVESVDISSWELKFLLRKSGGHVSPEVLNLNGGIPAEQIEMPERNMENETELLVVKYYSVDIRKVRAVYDKLRDNDNITLLGITRILF